MAGADVIEGKVCFYIWRIIHSVGSLKALYTSPSSRPVQSNTKSASPGTIIAMQQLRATTKSLTIARYSFIRLSQLGRHGENDNAQTLKR